MGDAQQPLLLGGGTLGEALAQQPSLFEHDVRELLALQ